jgi:hypothetical protein
VHQFGFIYKNFVLLINYKCLCTMHINIILKMENVNREGNTFVLIPKVNGSKHVEVYAFITIY